jgi:hypothetical protein
LFFSHFAPSIQKILHNANFTLDSKTTRFGLQNYNTHPAQNDVVLAIIFILKKKKKKKNLLGGQGVAGANPTTGLVVV